MFTQRLYRFLHGRNNIGVMAMQNAAQRLPPPGMEESDEEGELVYEFVDPDAEMDADIMDDNELDEWDGFHRCSSCTADLKQDEVDALYSICSVCFKTLEEYIKLGIEHLHADKIHTATLSRNCVLTVEGPNKRGLEKAICELFTYLGVNDRNIVQYESDTGKYEIHREYDLPPTIKKPRLKPYRCSECIMIERC